MITVDRDPRHLTPNVHDSWLYFLPAAYRPESAIELREDPDLDLLLDLAAERLGISA